MSGGAGGGAAAAAPAAGPMMQIKSENTILLEELRRRLDPEQPPNELPADIRISDFDDVHFRIDVPEEALHVVKVSMVMPGYAELKPLGVDAHLSSLYGSMWSAPYDGADVTVTVDTRALPAGHTPATAAALVANLRKHALAFPFVKLMSEITGGRGGAAGPIVLRTRPGEPLWLLPRADRLTVIFALCQAESTDRAITRVVAQEMTETNRVVNNAPPAAWTEKDAPPPAELRGLPPALVVAPNADTFIGYLTVSLFPSHFNTEAKKDNAASQMSLFRTYLTYHIKACKSYLHARMRSRADNLQKVLNRAVPEDPFADKEKKLASGRTFVRK